MALTVAQNFVIEDIVDEKGNKLGEIKFNPNDQRIIQKMSKIVQNLSEAIKKLNSMGGFKELSSLEIQNAEDFEKKSQEIQKMCDGINIETKAINEAFEDLYEIFGKTTIDIITCGTKDITLLLPLIDFITPYIQKARSSKINKYIPNNDIEVLE